MATITLTSEEYAALVADRDALRGECDELRGEVRTLYYGEGGSTWLGELAYGEDKTILAINIGEKQRRLLFHFPRTKATPMW